MPVDPESRKIVEAADIQVLARRLALRGRPPREIGMRIVAQIHRNAHLRTPIEISPDEDLILKHLYANPNPELAAAAYSAVLADIMFTEPVSDVVWE